MIGRATETIRKWTETARTAPVPGLPMVLDMLEWAYGRAVQGVPGLDGAEELAKTYAARYATAEAAVATLIDRQSGKAGITGFGTGCGGTISPVAMPPICWHAVSSCVPRRGDRASARPRSAKRRGPHVALACTTGRSRRHAEGCRDRIGTRLTRDALGWLSPVLVKKAEHAARLPVLTSITAAGAARLGRLVPVVGGVVAGGFDAAMTQLIGRTADRVFAAPKASAET